MNLDRYSDLHSPIHAWDARFKLISMLILVFVSASIQAPVNLIIVFTLSVTLVLLSRLPILFVLRTLRTPFIFTLIMVPVLSLTSGGETLVMPGFIKIYRSGLTLSGKIAVRALSLMMQFVVLFGTSKLHVTMKAMRSFRIPASLVSIFLFTYRYIFLYLEDMRKATMAAKLRGLSAQRGFVALKSAGNVMVNLLLRSYEQSDRVHSAMHLRGFSGSYNHVTEFHHGIKDLLKSLFCIAVCIFLIALELR